MPLCGKCQIKRTLQIFCADKCSCCGIWVMFLSWVPEVVFPLLQMLLTESTKWPMIVWLPIRWRTLITATDHPALEWWNAERFLENHIFKYTWLKRWYLWVSLCKITTSVTRNSVQCSGLWQEALGNSAWLRLWRWTESKMGQILFPCPLSFLQISVQRGRF